MVKVAYALMFVSLLACGKKTQDSNVPLDLGQAFQPSESIDKELVYKALQNAVEKNNLVLVKEIIADNKDIPLNTLNEDGETFLMFAIRKGYKELRNFFIEAKVDLNKGNAVGETPLIIAAKTGKIESVHRLVDEKKLNSKRIDIDRQDESGNTALIAAIKAKQTASAIELLRNGADYRLKDHDHYTAYDLAERLNLEEVLDLINLLMQSETGMPNAQTFSSLLKTAGVKSITSIVNQFPDIVRQHESINPLVLVLEHQSMNSVPVLVTLLIQNRADVNGPVDAAITPIVKAIQLNNIDYLKMLLARRANAQILDFDGKSTLVHAIEKNNSEMVDLLRSYGLQKNYTAYVNGRNIKFNACNIVREVAKTLKEKADLDRNEDIKDILKCGLRWLPFI